MVPFLTAEWRCLAMLNYEAPPDLLRPHVPEGTTLDSWQGRTYVSVVGFLFRDTGAGTNAVIPLDAFDAGSLARFEQLANEHGMTLDGRRIQPPVRLG